MKVTQLSAFQRQKLVVHPVVLDLWRCWLMPIQAEVSTWDDHRALDVAIILYPNIVTRTCSP